ncbi:Hypothetical predicted protein [Olea europaea subsp. europaea]|uniref:Uncharacterized protein n=1 Tax=Olea europaea subsp. europaea TaxID=158383 RepID=A0A8S0UF68_OLEEU|nr:Hypothetical predicted protein [Olea europaea subsp. europaea]
MSLQYQSKQVEELSHNLAGIEISMFFHSPDILCCLLKLRRGGCMDFEYLVPKNARLRAHISQQSDLRYVKTVLEHFNDQQCTDFRRKFVDATKKKEKAVTYTVHGFPIAMQFLFAVRDLGIRGNARNWGSVCSAIGSSIPTASELDVYQTATATEI